MRRRTCLTRAVNDAIAVVGILLLAAAIAFAVVLLRGVFRTAAQELELEQREAIPAAALVSMPIERERCIELHTADVSITGYCACCTPYAHCNRDAQGRVLVSTGVWVYPGSVVAVNPTVIPLGATVVIDGTPYLALDTGVTGNVVDVLLPHEEAHTAGVRRETVTWFMGNTDGSMR